MTDQTPSIVAYFVRHGTTDLNESNKFRGPLDPPLDDRGIDDAHKAADFFSGVKLSDGFSSDKQRAQTTARAVLEPKGLNYTPDPNLRSWNVGYLAGEDKATHQDDIEYFQRHPDEQIPNGESLNQFKARVKKPILNSIQAGISKGTPSLTVAHSSILKEVSSLVTGDHNKENVDPGGIIAVHHDGKKFGVKALLNKRTGKSGFGQ